MPLLVRNQRQYWLWTARVACLIHAGTMLAMVFAVVGCANKAKMADDPFQRPGGVGQMRRLAEDPRYETTALERTIQQANDSARQRDYAADVSTDPQDNRFRQASRSTDKGYDPLLDKPEEPALTSRSGDLVAAGSESAFLDYDRIRKRLDAIGASNLKFDRDPAMGITTFQCEVAYPDNPTLFRVFEARSKDELKAMLAVAEQAEQWAGQQPKH